MTRMSRFPGLFALILLPACAADSGTAPAPARPVEVVLSPATHTDDTFFATAACAADIGYNIRVGGPRTLVRHVSGNDETFSFGTQAFQGWIGAPPYTQADVDFEVQGGAEMFNIKRDESGAFRIRIHEGTLVFAAVDGSFKVVARHVIRLVPGQETAVNTWQCRITG